MGAEPSTSGLHGGHLIIFRKGGGPHPAVEGGCPNVSCVVQHPRDLTWSFRADLVGRWLEAIVVLWFFNTLCTGQSYSLSRKLTFADQHQKPQNCQF